MDLEVAKLTADLNNDRESQEAYAAALKRAKETGYTGRIQGPVMWTSDGQRIAPVDVFSNGKTVDSFISWLDD